MNASAGDAGEELRDSFSKALTKNLIVLALGVSINYVNGGMIHTFCKHQVHPPAPAGWNRNSPSWDEKTNLLLLLLLQFFYMNSRYILFIHLVVNDMIQVNLTMVLFLISYTVHQVSLWLCWLLLLPALITTENTALNLAFMALERYVAVCLPLRHVQVCTVRRTRMLLLLLWTTTACSCVSDLVFTLASWHPSLVPSQVFCLRHTAFPHPVIMRKRDATYSLFFALVCLTIFYTYVRILWAAKTASKDAKKARNTVALHAFQLLLCTASYLTPVLKDALQRRFPRSYTDTLFASFLLVQLLPRSASPVIYGLRDQAFRRRLRSFVLLQGSRVLG